MEFLRYFWINLIIVPSTVTGIDFTMSKQTDGTLTMTCGITETDVGSVYILEIRKLKSTSLSGSHPNDWTTLALIEPGSTDSPSLHLDITASTKDYVTGGSWDSTNPGGAIPTLSINIQKLVCNDAGYYRCELSYKSSTTQAVTSVTKNSTFTACADPNSDDSDSSVGTSADPNSDDSDSSVGTSVTGIAFTMSKQTVLLGTEGTLTMTCSITETDVSSVYLLEIRKLKSTSLSGSNANHWTTLALMEPGSTDSPSLHPDITASTKDYVAGGSWDSTNPGGAVLTLSMNIQKLVCDDARYYRCELSYKSSTAQAVTSVNKNSTFTAYVKPNVTSLDVRKNGNAVQGSSASDMAAVNVGNELKLTCTANIGSKPGTTIKWHRTSETASTNEFIGYQPPTGTFDEGTANSDNNCGYIRVAYIKYNATSADANRDNDLAFECYVTVTGDPYGSYTSNNKRFYADVTDPDGGDSDSSVGTAGGFEFGTAEFIGGIAVGLVLIVPIVLLVYFLWYRRRNSGEDCHRNQVQRQARDTGETELNDSATQPNIYEQLGNRTDTESTMTYHSLHASANEGQSSQSQYMNV